MSVVLLSRERPVDGSGRRKLTPVEATRGLIAGDNTGDGTLVLTWRGSSLKLMSM